MTQSIRPRAGKGLKLVGAVLWGREGDLKGDTPPCACAYPRLCVGRQGSLFSMGGRSGWAPQPPLQHICCLCSVSLSVAPPPNGPSPSAAPAGTPPRQTPSQSRRKVSAWGWLTAPHPLAGVNLLDLYTPGLLPPLPTGLFSSPQPRGWSRSMTTSPVRRPHWARMSRG